jgi:hypothetical protein
MVRDDQGAFVHEDVAVAAELHAKQRAQHRAQNETQEAETQAVGTSHSATSQRCEMARRARASRSRLRSISAIAVPDATHIAQVAPEWPFGITG